MRSCLSVVVNKEYIERLQQVIFHLHKADSVHTGTVSVHEVFRGQTVWQGDVETFDLSNHPKAKRAYAWSHADGKDDTGERFVSVLEIPPVTDAVTAVRASIVADVKKSKVKRNPL